MTQGRNLRLSPTWSCVHLGRQSCGSPACPAPPCSCPARRPPCCIWSLRPNEKNRQGSGFGLRRVRTQEGARRALTDDGGEDGCERGEEVGGGDGAEGQERHRHERGRGGAGNPSSASSRREHLGVGVGSAACGRLCSLVVAFPCVGERLRFSGREGREGRGRLAGEAMRGVGAFIASRLPGLTRPPRLDDAAASKQIKKWRSQSELPGGCGGGRRRWCCP